MGKEIKLPYMLKKLMAEKNLTMKELGEKVGKSESAVSYWVSGKITPRIGVIQKLADIFNVTTDELIYGIADSNPNTSLGDYEENINYLKDKPGLLELYEDIVANDQLVLLFDKAKKLSPEDLEQVLKIIDTFNKETR
ncbi:helix-turn-helix domain-containing protein [Thomasclavelia spiroformis]|uniref:helix-turn-helix domain-containing protein n=1 Tax=Thomasclavelia spiroformis TaxID=29348 RepID=UPI0026DAB3F0|nr:helix-turn-helix transcriptional regulator [Thomasclavelia spiroformis]